MERPSMNAARMARCMKTGKSRAACMKEVYPEGNGKSGGGKKKPDFTKKKTGGKKPPARY